MMFVPRFNGKLDWPLRSACVLLLGSTVLVGCSGAAVPPGNWRLETSERLSDIISDSTATAVLVIDPGECLQCLGVVAGWLDWRQRQSGRFLLLLSRRPEAQEQKILMTAGIPVDGVIVDGPAGDSTPIELVFSGGDVVYRGRSERL